MTDESLLLSRAVDRSASSADWDALEDGARRDPQLAVRLLGELRDACELSAALDARLDALPIVALPLGEGVRTARVPSDERAARPSILSWRLPRAAALAGTGWAAACVLALLLVLRAGGGDDARDRRDPQQPHDVLERGDVVELDDGADASVDALADESPPSPDEARVLHEFPRVLVETRPTDDGRIEVTWLRRALESQTVDDAYQIVEDEFGRPSVVPADLSTLAVSDIL